MTAQEDLIKRAVELRKQAAKDGKPLARPAESTKVVVNVKATTPRVEVKEEAEKSPQEKLLDRVIADKKAALAKSKKRPAKKAPAKKKKKTVTKKKKKVVSKKVTKPVKKKVEKELKQVDVRFTGKLLPRQRSFAPTLRKTMLRHFQSVSVGRDRAIVRNPNNIDDPEALIRDNLKTVGINVAKIEKIKNSELNPDTAFRVFYG